MANLNMNIVVSAVDKATGTIWKIVWKVEKQVTKASGGFMDMINKQQETFQWMAIWWWIAFASLTAWINKATQAAAQDEGTRNKFATVFWEWTDNMNKFVNDIRTRMPVATGTIQRMAADMQDLLVPIGLSRELWAEMTQWFLEVANAVGAFNDVNPANVLEAIKSWLTGSSEPLKQFWVDASVTALEVRALEMWLLKAGQKLWDLEPAVANQIKAQALLAQVTAQSSDAINGFEQNSDSLLFRQMELQASIEDMTGTLWKAFIPILDWVVKAIVPIIKRVSEWVEANPQLTKNILIVSAWVTWLITVLWTLWVAIPAIVGWLGAMKIAFLAMGWPITILIWLLWWLAIYIYKNWWEISAFWSEVWQNIKQSTVETWNNVKDTIMWVIDPLVTYVQNKLDKIRSIIQAVKWVGNIVWSKLWIWWDIEARATWWPVANWKPYIVGEKWPELFVPKSNGGIVPNNAMGGVNVNFGDVNINNWSDEVAFAQMVENTITKAIRNSNLWYV